MTKKIEIEEVIASSISLENSLVGLQKFSEQYFTSTDSITLSNLNALNGLIDSIGALANKNAVNIEKYYDTNK